MVVGQDRTETSLGQRSAAFLLAGDWLSSRPLWFAQPIKGLFWDKSLKPHWKIGKEFFVINWYLLENDSVVLSSNKATSNIRG